MPVPDLPRLGPSQERIFPTATVTDTHLTIHYSIPNLGTKPIYVHNAIDPRPHRPKYYTGPAADFATPEHVAYRFYYVNEDDGAVFLYLVHGNTRYEIRDRQGFPVNPAMDPRMVYSTVVWPGTTLEGKMITEIPVNPWDGFRSRTTVDDSCAIGLCDDIYVRIAAIAPEPSKEIRVYKWLDEERCNAAGGKRINYWGIVKLAHPIPVYLQLSGETWAERPTLYEWHPGYLDKDGDRIKAAARKRFPK